MNLLPALPLAETGQFAPGLLFLATGAILVFVAAFLGAAFGTWFVAVRAHAHTPAAPAAVPTPVASATTAPTANDPTPEVLALIAAVVGLRYGASARVHAVKAVPTGSLAVETGTPQWSVEGRRQIYSSHQVR